MAGISSQECRMNFPTHIENFVTHARDERDAVCVVPKWHDQHCRASRQRDEFSSGQKQCSGAHAFGSIDEGKSMLLSLMTGKYVFSI
jgi:hypothetical protein